MPGSDKGCPALPIRPAWIEARQWPAGFVEAALAMTTRLAYTGVTYIAFRMINLFYPLDTTYTWPAGA